LAVYSVYKNFNIPLVWVGFLFTLAELLSTISSTTLVFLEILLTFACFYIVKRLPLLADKGCTYMSTVIQGITIVILFFFNMEEYPNTFTGIFFNCIAQTLAMVALRDIIKVIEEKAKTKLTIIYISGYFLLVLTQGLLVQTDISFTNAVISIIYGVTAFAWIIAGFKLKNKSVRKAGLTLAIAASGKLLVVDTWGLETSMKIISYISLGALLFAISLFYQHLSKNDE
jgi:uncharacterized membrane protein